MRELTRAEAAELAKNGTKFMSNGRELSHRDIHQLRAPARKQNLLHQLFERLISAITDGFAQVATAATRMPVVTPQAKPAPMLPPPATNVTLNAPEKKPVQWVFDVQTNPVTGQIESITATPKL